MIKVPSTSDANVTTTRWIALTFSYKQEENRKTSMLHETAMHFFDSLRMIENLYQGLSDS